MAKQTINVGAAANDGTGDPIRTAWTKANANFTELYDTQFSGDYGDLTNAPTVPTDLTDLGIADGSNNQVLTTDGNGTFTFKTSPTGIQFGDLSVTVAGAANTSTLTYNAGNGNFIYVPPLLTSYAKTADLPTSILDLGISDGSSGQVLTTDGSGNFSFSTVSSNTGGGGTGLSGRSSKAGTTASIANDATANLDITGFKGYALLTIQTSAAAWVRVYANAASRSADAGRAETSDPAPDAGVIAEVITTGAQTVLVSPGVIGYNLESTPTTTIPCAVKNKSGAAAAITVTLTVLQLEA